MRFVRVVNESRRTVLGARIRIADTWLARLRGFLFRPEPAVGEGLFLAPCRGVHMYGMRFALDVLMIDAAGMVVATHAKLTPGGRTPVYRHARYALELPHGAIAATATAIGDQLSWVPATAASTNGAGVPLHTLRRMAAEAARTGEHA